MSSVDFFLSFYLFIIRLLHYLPRNDPFNDFPILSVCDFTQVRKKN